MYGLVIGSCDPWPTWREMVAALRSGGLEVSEGQYAIRVIDCENFSFEHYGGDISNPSVAADADSADAMLAAASRVSRALAQANIRHGFEIWNCQDNAEDGEDELVAYLHHDWPRGTNTPQERAPER